ncbi:glycosyltransferase family 39 protein [Candidatus Woesebacteria bacterium]|nr:glycosyltransferase family 39 protein [Candidatus Woesebacteria bacterium]
MNWFPKLKLRDLWIILGITLVYFATRLYNLNSLPIFVDEAIYSRWSQIALHDASWRFISLTDGKQPLFIWVAMPFLHFIKDPLIATRLVSVFSGYLTLIGLWYAGFLLKDKRTGYLAATLGLITPFLFFYDRFAVMESMLTASGIWLFNLAYLLAKSKRLDVALILGISAGLAFLVKSPAQVFILLIPSAYLFMHEDKTRFSKANLLKYFGLLIVVYILAELINNLQRLSPWMYMITRKNGDFVISPIQMLSEHPYRIWQNFVDSQRWLIAYLTLPIYLISLYGGIKLIKNMPQFLLVSAWFWGPLMALCTTALLYRPRYLVFIVPYLLLYAVNVFPKRTKDRLLILAVLSIWPIRFMYQAYMAPLTMPLIKADQDYVSGWAAGNGVKEISAWLVQRSHEVQKDLDVYTEGTFGLLPHGVELYTSDLSKQVKITGLYPILSVPPLLVRQNAEINKETYFILNNTQVTTLPPNSEEILSFKKADDSYIRLYRIFP